ncbi:MAG: ATP-binding protein [Cyanobacteria bacterium J06598_1]
MSASLNSETLNRETPNNGATDWHGQNEAYLLAAIAWLRLKLLQQIDRVRANATPPTERRRFQKAPPTPSSTVSEPTLKEAAEKRAAAAKTDPPSALAQLTQLFDLSDFEQNVLLLCAAVELDTQICELCAQAQGDPNRPYPTFALALSLFDHPTWDALSAEQSLRYWQLIQVTRISTQPLSTSPLQIDEHIVDYLKGVRVLDSRLSPFLVPLSLPTQPIELPPSQVDVVSAIATHLQNPASTTIQLVGADSVSKQVVIQQVASSFGLYLYRLPIELLPTHVEALETLIRLWQRESRLMPVLLYLDAHHTNDAKYLGPESALHRFLLKNVSLCFLSLQDIHHPLEATSLAIDISKPTPEEQQILWEQLIGAVSPQSPAILAEQFSLNTASIQRIASRLPQKQPTHPEQPEKHLEKHLEKQLWQDCLASTRPQLDRLAQRLTPVATWDNIVLPPEETDLLKQISQQIKQRNIVYQNWGFRQQMNRGLGISVLFAGESGTGKTMAAEVIANDLQLNLYRIDLSAVVSKYIGETEKNLRRLFDAAEDGGAILFFDEADALFGKRSEVKDAHDRHANIEINYLLQRIEAYSGLAILATNLKQSIDNAFLRRLRFVVTFPFPNPKERQTIWQRAFPSATPVAPLDYKRLARFNLTGGNIHNIALNAAFLAAQAKSDITMSLVLAAARSEFRKLERPINEADFQALS